MLSIVYQCIPTVMLIVIVIWDGITCLALQKNDQHVFFHFVLVVKHFLLYLC